MAINNALKKIRHRAKQITRKHPRTKWTNAIKEASQEYRAGKLGNSNRQTGTSYTKRDKQRKAKRPGKRKSYSGNVYTERRKNRSDKPGSLTGVSAGILKSELKKRLKGRIDNAVVRKYHATTKRAKKKIQKQITQTKQQLRKLS